MHLEVDKLIKMYYINNIETNVRGQIMRRPTNSRDTALELVDNGVVSAEDMLTMALKYMSTDDVEDMLDCNELSERFMEEEDA